jgi:cytochrome P450
MNGNGHVRQLYGEVWRAFAPLVRIGRPEADAPPGPRGRHVQAGMRRDPARTLAWARERYGDVVRLQIGPDLLHLDAYLISDPELVRGILGTHAERYCKAPTYGVMRPFLGDGLVTAEGPTWQRHRRLVAPVFDRRHVEALDRAITDAGKEAVARLRNTDGLAVNLSSELSRLTLRAVGDALFGADLGVAAIRIADALDTFQRFTESVFDRPLTWPLSRLDGRSVGAAVKAANRQLDKVVGDLLADPPEDGVTLLSLLRASRDDSGATLADQELRDELVTFILAGHETTALALAWTFVELGRHPEVLRRLQDEVDEVLSDRTPTSADLPKLTYTSAVLQEAMRLHPPAWVLERATVEDEVLGGFRVPAGTTVMISPYVLHRHPDHWDVPEAFDPERFLDERAAHRHRHAYLPFGAGRRQCVGAGFAMLEATLLLTMLVRDLRFDLRPGRPVEHDPSMTLRIRGGLVATVQARSEAAVSGAVGARGVEWSTG